MFMMLSCRLANPPGSLYTSCRLEAAEWTASESTQVQDAELGAEDINDEVRESGASL